MTKWTGLRLKITPFIKYICVFGHGTSVKMFVAIVLRCALSIFKRPSGLFAFKQKFRGAATGGVAHRSATAKILVDKSMTDRWVSCWFSHEFDDKRSFYVEPTLILHQQQWFNRRISYSMMTEGKSLVPSLTTRPTYAYTFRQHTTRQ